MVRTILRSDVINPDQFITFQMIIDLFKVRVRVRISVKLFVNVSLNIMMAKFIKIEQHCFVLKNSFGVYRRVYRREEKEFEKNRVAITEKFCFGVHQVGIMNAGAPTGSCDEQANCGAGAGDSNYMRTTRDGGLDAQRQRLLVSNENTACASSEQLLASTPTAQMETTALMTSDTRYPTLASDDVEADTSKALCYLEVCHLVQYTVFKPKQCC